MENIKKYLSQAEHDFDEGFKLFEAKSKNRRMIDFLRRKRVKSKLLYELRKIVGGAALALAPISVGCTSKPANLCASAFTEAENNSQGDLKETPLRFSKEDIEGAPEEIVATFNQATEIYHRERSVHEAMRVAQCDEHRAVCRQELLELESRRKDLYAILDIWKATGVVIDSDEASKKNPENLEAENPADLAKQVSAANARLYRNLAKAIDLADGEKKEKYIASLSADYKFLKSCGKDFKQETTDKLAQVINIEE